MPIGNETVKKLEDKILDEVNRYFTPVVKAHESKKVSICKAIEWWNENLVWCETDNDNIVQILGSEVLYGLPIPSVCVVTKFHTFFAPVTIRLTPYPITNDIGRGAGMSIEIEF